MNFPFHRVMWHQYWVKKEDNSDREGDQVVLPKTIPHISVELASHVEGEAVVDGRTTNGGNELISKNMGLIFRSHQLESIKEEALERVQGFSTFLLLNYKSRMSSRVLVCTLQVSLL